MISELFIKLLLKNFTSQILQLLFRLLLILNHLLCMTINFQLFLLQKFLFVIQLRIHPFYLIINGIQLIVLEVLLVLNKEILVSLFISGGLLIFLAALIGCSGLYSKVTNQGFLLNELLSGPLKVSIHWIKGLRPCYFEPLIILCLSKNIQIRISQH